MQMSEAAVRAATSFAETAGPFLSWMTNSSTVRRGRSDVEARAEAFNDRWTQERPASEEAASSFAGRILPELTNAILDKLDLTQIAIDHLDIDRILDSVDLDAVIERVDLDAVIHRVDLARIATEVIGDIDLPELIRESTGAVTSETVRAVRMRSAEADLFMGRLIDRLLMRKSADDEPEDPMTPARRRQGEGRGRNSVSAREATGRGRPGRGTRHPGTPGGAHQPHDREHPRPRSGLRLRRGHLCHVGRREVPVAGSRVHATDARVRPARSRS